MTSELREGLLGSAAAREPGQGDKGPEDDDNDARLASRGFGGFMRETGRIALDALPERIGFDNYPRILARLIRAAEYPESPWSLVERILSAARRGDT